MSGKKIDRKTTIAHVIAMKGELAGTIIDRYLCNGEKTCCPGTTLTLETAAYLKRKEHKLVQLIDELNKL